MNDRMKDSELLRDLISLAFDRDPAPTDITLRQALDLFARTIAREHGTPCTNVPLGGAAAKCPPLKTSGHGKQADTPSVAETRDVLSAVGPGAAEKRAIYQRLSDFRASHGLGCLSVVAMAANRVVTEDELRAMLDGEKYPLSRWKVVNAALDHIEKKGQ